MKWSLSLGQYCIYFIQFPGYFVHFIAFVPYAVFLCGVFCCTCSCNCCKRLHYFLTGINNVLLYSTPLVCGWVRVKPSTLSPSQGKTVGFGVTQRPVRVWVWRKECHAGYTHLNTQDERIFVSPGRYVARVLSSVHLTNSNTILFR